MSELDFPVDEVTLELLDASCRINPDSGHTELFRFLDMGTRVSRVTNEATNETYPDMTSAIEDADEEMPVFFVEHESGYEPHSPHSVIRSLVAEIQRLRSAPSEARKDEG